MNLLENYYPSRDELTEEQLDAAYTRVRAFFAESHPELDTSPTTVLGDQVLNPLATFLAASSVAQGRILSDLDLENVKNKIIFNCPFVEGYLGNFSVYDRPRLRASGVIRLTFNRTDTAILDRGLRFVFTVDTETYYPKLTFPGDLEILPPGFTPEAGKNQLVRVPVGLDSWVVDIPVEGNLITPVPQGSVARLDREVTGLVAASSAVAFDSGQPPTSLPLLAERARRTIFAASPGSRSAVTQALHYVWPETKIASAILTGDRELLRSENPAGLSLAAPSLDVYYRSVADMQPETQVVAIPYIPQADKFVGELNLQTFPSLIESVFPSALSTTPPSRVIVFSKSPTPAYPGVTGGFDPRAPLWVMVDPPLDDSGENLVPRVSDTEGNLYGLFTVAYLSDPLLSHVAQYFEAPDNAPLGVDVSVQAGPLMHIRQMDIFYERTPGTTMTLSRAREAIADYVNSVGYPSAFSEAPIFEEMRFSGAKLVREISYDRRLVYSPAERVLFQGSVLDDIDFPALNRSLVPAADYEVALNTALDGASYAVPQDTTGLVPDVVSEQVVDVASGTTNARAATQRNIRYFIDPDAINFHERETQT